MFVIILRFADKARASDFMEAHKAWIARGFDTGIFMLMGSLQPAMGGTLFAEKGARQEIEDFVAQDPFVAEGIVTAEVLEIAPNRTDERLAFLLA